MKKYLYILLPLAIAMLASCASHKKAESSTAGASTVAVTTVGSDAASQEKLDKEYVRKVFSNAQESKNIVSKIDFSIGAMGKDISVDGKIYMRKDEIIRIVLSPLGLMEVGRLEFTPDHVLIVNRMDKEYVKATYNDLDFLKANGLDFYSLQALFWNELFLPGEKKLNASQLAKFAVAPASGNEKKVAVESGRLGFTWTTDPSTSLIQATTVDYAKGTAQASVAGWTYSRFSDLAGKKFPASHQLSFQSKAIKKGGVLKLNIDMKKLTTDSNWDVKYEVSGKYKEMNAEALFGKLLNM